MFFHVLPIICIMNPKGPDISGRWKAAKMEEDHHENKATEGRGRGENKEEEDEAERESEHSTLTSHHGGH